MIFMKISNICFKPDTFEFSTKYHYSSTMTNIIGRALKLGLKKGSNLASPKPLWKIIQPLHIVMISPMETLMWKVNNYYLQRRIMVQKRMYNIQHIIAFKQNLYQSHTPQTR